jgi:lipopolysaccharide/colanic/teichoic acid biosynthesis glycosyltransferase
LKRIIDIIVSLFGLILFSPIIVPFIIIIFLQDFSSPFYIAKRVGKNEELFKMIKLRSMIINADKSGVDSTSSNDMRITKVGKLIRKFKLDEITQLWNVLIGDMSLVGPRPNVKNETDIYTVEEKKLLKVKPGITDFASIVFSDEGEILSNSKNPDIDYNQLIRPWKSRLGLLYVNNMNFILDIKLILYTVLGIFSKKKALNFLIKDLKKIKANNKIIEVSKRVNKLIPYPPPGSNKIIKRRC